MDSGKPTEGGVNFSFRPAKREQTPLILGLGGPSKSGKTYSALRVAKGMANGGTVAMVNTEGKRGHMYADKFSYHALDIDEPFSYEKYRQAVLAAKEANVAVLIIDSISHAHEGPGGMLDQHEQHLKEKAGNDWDKRKRMTWTAWIAPKAEEAHFINTIIQVDFPIILCFRCKEKLKILPGKDPIPMGWQPICSDRIPFETTAMLILPPGSKGVPDLSALASELREPLDTIIKPTQINEDLGRQLAAWSTNTPKAASVTGATTGATGEPPVVATNGEYISPDDHLALEDELRKHKRTADQLIAAMKAAGVTVPSLAKMPASVYERALKWATR